MFLIVAFLVLFTNYIIVSDMESASKSIYSVFLLIITGLYVLSVYFL